MQRSKFISEQSESDREKLYARFARKLGMRIVQLRREYRWTQEELAQKAQLNHGYLSLLESGDRLPSLVTLANLSKIFDVPLAQMFVATPPNSK